MCVKTNYKLGPLERIKVQFSFFMRTTIASKTGFIFLTPYQKVEHVAAATLMCNLQLFLVQRRKTPPSRDGKTSPLSPITETAKAYGKYRSY